MPNKRLIKATEQFGERLKRASGLYTAQTGKDLSQAELAERVGQLVGKDYGQTAAGSWFRGTVPNITVIAALAYIYGVRAAWLAFEEGSMLPHTEGARPLDEPLTRVAVGRRKKR